MSPKNENKTKPTKDDVENYLKGVEDVQKKADSFKILEMMKEITKEEPVMWGKGLIGFDQYHYKYPSGREGDWFKVGFAPRKQNISVHVLGYIEDKFGDLFSKLGKYKMGKGCIYIKKLEDVNIAILKEIIKKSIEEIDIRYP